MSGQYIEKTRQERISGKESAYRFRRSYLSSHIDGGLEECLSVERVEENREESSMFVLRKRIEGEAKSARSKVKVGPTTSSRDLDCFSQVALNF